MLGKDRDRYFERSWKEVVLDLPSEEGVESIQVKVSEKSFGEGSCQELRSKEIGQWLIKRGMGQWEKGKPPKFEVEVVGPGHFALKGKRS